MGPSNADLVIEGRLSKIETRLDHQEAIVERVVLEVTSIRKALWVLVGVLLTGPAKEIVLGLLK